MDKNPFLYTSANPINLKDPSGLFPLPGLGFSQFGACFSLHTLSFGNSLLSARSVVDMCKEGFSSNMWNKSFFNLSGNLPTTAHDLFGWYIFEKEQDGRLDFDANKRLTQELSKALSIRELRSNYYSKGDTPARPEQYYFNAQQQGECLGDALTNRHYRK